MKKLDGWLIYTLESSQRNNISINWFIDEARKLGLQIDLFIMEKFQIMMINNSLKVMYDGIDMQLPRFALFRGYNYKLAKHFELLGIKVFNSSKSMEQSLDKAYTHQVLSGHGIDMPDTIFESENHLDIDSISSILGYPLVIKGTEGKGGDQVYLVNNHDEFREKTKGLKDDGYNLLFQKFISSSYGKDIRAFVVGDKVIGSVIRISKEGFKANYSQGGTCEGFELTKEAAEIAIKASKILGLDIAGVDLLFIDNGFVLCEVNANPAFKTIYNTSTVNVPGKIMEHIQKSLEIEAGRLEVATSSNM